MAACAEENPARHLPDALPIDSAGDVALHVEKAGNGDGSITSSPAGLSCDASCEAMFPYNSTVTLTAEPAVGSMFTGWSGACSGATPTCDVTLASAANVTATFTLEKHTVTVTRQGAGNGMVMGHGMSCGASCTIEVDHGTALSLSASPASLSVFAGWGGACSGTGACELTVTKDVTVNASFALDDFTLFTFNTGNGAGTVTSTPGGIACGTDCEHTYIANQMVTLTATPATGSSFGGWAGGGCTGTGTCIVSMTMAKTVTAMFTLNQYALTVTPAGNGTGSVSGTGITCGGDCDHSYDYGTEVTLTAAPSTGSTFAGWSGACTGTGSCTVTIDQAKSVTATFTLTTHQLAVATVGNGTVAGGGINCGSTCTGMYNYGTSVTLAATPSTGYSFSGWSGACSGSGTCNVTMTQARSVTATFTINTYALTVTPPTNGSIAGTGITCGADCTETFNHGTNVTLTATPATGYAFGSWTGACTGTGTCTVSMTQARNVGATFSINTYALTVTPAVNGTVSGTGISCGTDCSETFNHGTNVTLTAMPATGYSFSSWTGACSGTGTCTVSMTQARTVGASFTLNSYLLSVTPPSNGSVSGTGISCGTDCSQSFNHGTNVTLSALPATGYSFTGWTGACTGTGTCTVSMTQARSVGATFTLNSYLLTVTPSSNGTIAGTGIACGTDCSESLTHGTSVTLTAMPATGYSFTGWTGACSGTGTCTVSMTQARTVGATFSINTYALTVAPPSNGTVTGSGIVCGTDCNESFNHGTNVTLTATPAVGYSFAGWSGACTGTGTCTVAMTQARNVGASFTINSYLLSVTPPSNGSVTGSGISCGSDCSQSFTHGTPVTLAATPAVGYSFTGWTGACTGTGTCTVSMTQARSVGATFAINSYLLSVTPPSNGTVAGTGITCGTDCSEAFTHGTSVVLTAMPVTNYTFTGWTGACSGTGTCTVSMTQARNVGATFTINSHLLSVTPPSNGAISGSGISCGGDCNESFTHGTSVTLTATPAAGFTFSGWTGACSGGGTCTVSMTQARTVGATFVQSVHTLFVSKGGDGDGTVAGGGIDCGTNCDQGFPQGTMVTLTAKASLDDATLSTFTGWSGACSGTGTCTVTLNANVFVTANFKLKPNLIFVTSKTTSGAMGGLDGADLMCNTLAKGSGLPGKYVAYLSSISGNTPLPASQRFGSAKGWVRVDGAPVMQTPDQMHLGTLFNAPQLTETGLDVATENVQFAWTGTGDDGSFHSACSPASVFAPWNGTSNAAMMGLATVTTTQVVLADTIGCGSSLRLYCLGVDRATELQ